MKRLVITLLLLNSLTAFGQGALERAHPRVSELQDKMTEYARDYLKARLPDIPYLVSVRIEPLRRAPNSGYQVQNEKLPYFEVNEEEIRDEWDDPSASLYTLQSRIQKATVTVTLPKSLRGEEVDEIKDSLTNLLRLIPGRDEIRVELRTWSLGETFWYYVGLSLSLLTLLVLGIFFVSRGWASKITNAISQIKPKESAENAAPVQPVNGNTEIEKNNSKGNLKFSDPLRTREFVNSRIQDLLKNPNFPNLEAMIEMDKVAARAPREFGSLMMEFPREKQAQLFGLSYQPSWLEAFSDPGELGSEALELLDRLTRIHYESKNPNFQRLLIQFWRLGLDRAKFCRDISKDEALAVLRALPTSVSIPTGREAFPGAWAVLLESDFKQSKITDEQVEKIMNAALKLRPLNDIKTLEKYRQERDLLGYLRVASVVEEREIYEALPSESFLWSVRPPFYKIFTANPETLKMLVERITLDEWGLSLFNVPRDMRKQVEDLFTAKQKYLVINKMQSIDKAHIDKRTLGEARERIGAYFYNLSKNTLNLQTNKDKDSKGNAESGEEAA